MMARAESTIAYTLCILYTAVYSVELVYCWQQYLTTAFWVISDNYTFLLHRSIVTTLVHLHILPRHLHLFWHFPYSAFTWIFLCALVTPFCCALVAHFYLLEITWFICLFQCLYSWVHFQVIPDGYPFIFYHTYIYIRWPFVILCKP